MAIITLARQVAAKGDEVAQDDAANNNAKIKAKNINIMIYTNNG